MASDIVLVLRSEHREILALAEQCSRASRGFHDPPEDLRRRLTAHLAASAAITLRGGRPREIDVALDALREDLAKAREVASAARALVSFEQESALPWLEGVLIGDRRRMGKVFRVKREGALRQTTGTQKRRRRSQTELYEQARRAGIEQRSRMTLPQLEAAVSAWERNQAGRSQPSAG